MEKKETEKQNNVASKVKSVIIVVLLIVIAFMFFIKAGGNNAPADENGLIPNEEIEYQQGELKKNPPITGAKDSVALPVIEDFTVSKLQPYANLFNPTDNEGKFIIKYTFKDTKTDEIIYESDWLKAGFKYSVDFGNFLDEGQYDVTVTVSTKDVQNYEDRNGITTKLFITVKGSE